MSELDEKALKEAILYQCADCADSNPEMSCWPADETFVLDGRVICVGCLECGDYDQDRAVKARNLLAAAPAPTVSGEAICKSCGQQFPIDAEHDCPGLLPAPTMSGEPVAWRYKHDPASPHWQTLHGRWPKETWPDYPREPLYTHPAPTMSGEGTAVTRQMVNTAYDEGKRRQMTGSPRDFRAVLEKALACRALAGEKP